MKKFLWGCATSSLQIEGAVEGRGPSIWDEFCRRPGTIRNGDVPDVACDHVNRLEEDLDLLAELGVNAYRFSIAWPRMFPNGRGELNEPGAAFYDRLLDGCLTRGIQPCATLYHWDLPLALEKEYGGWRSPQIVEDFTAYARACFQRYGDRVPVWITLNEPWCAAILGHGMGVHAPGRKDPVEPFLVGHHLLLAHAAAVEVYRTEFQQEQGGLIGISNNCDWREPYTDTAEDRAAAEVALECMLGWFADPVWKGDYPESMKSRLGDRLPAFTDGEKSRLLGSSDFFGLNHYSACYARKVDHSEGSWVGNTGIFGVEDVKLEAIPDLECNATDWAIVPWGFRKLLHWIDQRYGQPGIVVTENGTCIPGDRRDVQLDDGLRCRFLTDYLGEMRRTMGEGAKVDGYFHWSLMDNFEWSKGYDIRFGLIHVDFNTHERTPKTSFNVYRNLIRQEP